jgi:hypothetical protein
VIISPHSNINIHYYENGGLPIPGTLYYLNFFIKSSKGHPGHKLFNAELKKRAMVVAIITTFNTSNTPKVKVVDGHYHLPLFLLLPLRPSMSIPETVSPYIY